MLSAALAVWPALFAGSVAVEDKSEGCLNRIDVAGRLQSVLLRAKRFGGRELTVSAIARRPDNRDAQASVSLKAVERNGDVVIDRSFELRREDCRSAGALLETVLGQALKELPDAITEEQPAQASVRIGLGLDGAVSPAIGDVAILAAADAGSERNRLLGTALIRISTPENLGPGRFYQAMALVGVGWRYAGPIWSVAVEVRGGLVMLSGSGYDRSDVSYGPWAEGALTVLVAVGPIQVGPTVSASPIVQDVLVRGQTDIAQVPQFRAGVLLALPIARWEI